MIITQDTSYEIGQTVYVIYNNRIVTGTVQEIYFERNILNRPCDEQPYSVYCNVRGDWEQSAYTTLRRCHASNILTTESDALSSLAVWQGSCARSEINELYYALAKCAKMPLYYAQKEVDKRALRILRKCYRDLKKNRADDIEQKDKSEV